MSSLLVVVVTDSIINSARILDLSRCCPINVFFGSLLLTSLGYRYVASLLIPFTFAGYHRMLQCSMIEVLVITNNCPITHLVSMMDLFDGSLSVVIFAPFYSMNSAHADWTYWKKLFQTVLLSSYIWVSSGPLIAFEYSLMQSEVSRYRSWVYR